MCRKKIVLLTLLSIGVQNVFSQNELKKSDSTLGSISLKEVNVSAVRIKTKKDDLPQQVRVITKKEIEQTGAKDLTDVLKKNAGVDVIQYPGMVSGIGIRGFRPQFSGINQRVLVLIDGHHAGATNLAMIDLNNIEQVEVLKGPASALYGSQAMGGVVNIITKKNKGDLKKTIYGSFGSYSTLETGATVSGAINTKLNFDIDAKYVQQNNDYRIGSDNMFRKMFKKDEVSLTYYNNENEIDSVRTTKDIIGDGERRQFTKYKYQSGRVRFGYLLHKNWNANVSGTFFSANNVQAPGDISGGNASQSIKNPYRYGVDFNLEGKISDKHNLSFKAYNSLENSDYRSVSGGVLADFVTSDRTNKWIGLQLQDNIKIKEHNIVVGVDQSNIETSSKSYDFLTGEERSPYSPNYGIYSSAIFAQMHLSLLDEKLKANAGVRLDNIVFDVKNTPMLEKYVGAKENYAVMNPSAGAKYAFHKYFNLHASGGQAFVTPDAYNVAGYLVSGSGVTDDVVGKVNVTYGNPNLKPEKGLTVDGGVGYKNRNNGFVADFTFFNTYVRDKISLGTTEVLSALELTSKGDTIASKTTYVNADKSLMNGLEMNLSWDIGAFVNHDYSFRLFINAVKYFTLESEFKKTSLLGDDIYTKAKIHNVANLSFNYGVEYHKNDLSARLSGRYVGERYDTDWTDYVKRPEVEYKPFMVLDLALGFRVSVKGEVALQVNNITDENYYEKRGFNLQGRNLNIKYTYSL